MEYRPFNQINLSEQGARTIKFALTLARKSYKELHESAWPEGTQLADDMQPAIQTLEHAWETADVLLETINGIIAQYEADPTAHSAEVHEGNYER